MIAVDTSALIAIVRDEPDADACIVVLEREPEVLISAGTLAEAFIVALRKNVGQELQSVIERLNFQVIPVTAASAHRVGGIYERWGRGAKSAGLNFGDCFAYDVAKQNRCPLLYVGRDFARTDVKSAL